MHDIERDSVRDGGRDVERDRGVKESVMEGITGRVTESCTRLMCTEYWKNADLILYSFTIDNT